ncbi:uncharacterized protein [Coffea arabica]|uniref:Retrotransposon gag domain-containing protein n=1 Tax=Coffea arabica TaxID=13443 RepID=A0A6P6T1Q0_COFAR|nr:uncharacterized protein LOC113696755 [Coffea arabica]
MIDIFAALHYSEERQVTFTVFQLEGAARSWWNIKRTKWEREQTPRTWMNFVREFNAKYFPPLIQEKKEDEFIRLRQGTQSVAEYENQFTRLSKFSPELILTEHRTVRRFIQGLNVEIQKDLDVAQITTFSDAVEKALRAENARLQVRNFQVRKRGLSGARGTQPRGGQTGRGQQRSASHESSATVSRGPCGFCGKLNHAENNCWRKERKRLRCGSAEHQIANCPVQSREMIGTTQSSKATSEQSKVEGVKPKVPARVYSVEQCPVPDSAEVVEARYDAQLDCKRKVVEFRIPGEATLRLDVRGSLASSAMLSAIRARKLLSRGAQGFLAFLINTPTDKLKVEDVLVVGEYPDVFPDELVNLSPEREIEFEINLLSGTSPISKTPYHMAPAEFKELKL